MKTLYESILDNDFDIGDEVVLRSILKEIQDSQSKYWFNPNFNIPVEFDFKKKNNKNILCIGAVSSPVLTPTAYIDSDVAQLLESYGVSDIQSKDETVTIVLTGDNEISGINITAHTVEIDCYLNGINITAHAIKISEKKYSIMNCNIVTDNLNLLCRPTSRSTMSNSKITISEYIKLYADNIEDILRQYGLWFWDTKGRQNKVAFSKRFIKNASKFNPFSDLLKSFNLKISSKPHIYIGHSPFNSFPGLIFKSDSVSNFKYWNGYQVAPVTAKRWVDNGQIADCSNGYQAILLNCK